MGRTRVLNKWSISFWLKSSVRRVLRMWRHLLAFVSLSLTCSLNLQLGWKVSPSNTRLSHWGILKPRYRLCRHYRKSRTTFLMSMESQRSLCWYSWILARPIETVLHGILLGGQWSVFTGLCRIWSWLRWLITLCGVNGGLSLFVATQTRGPQRKFLGLFSV